MNRLTAHQRGVLVLSILAGLWVIAIAVMAGLRIWGAVLVIGVTPVAAGLGAWALIAVDEWVQRGGEQ